MNLAPVTSAAFNIAAAITLTASNIASGPNSGVNYHGYQVGTSGMIVPTTLHGVTINEFSSSTNGLEYVTYLEVAGTVAQSFFTSVTVYWIYGGVTRGPFTSSGATFTQSGGVTSWLFTGYNLNTFSSVNGSTNTYTVTFN